MEEGRRRPTTVKAVVGVGQADQVKSSRLFLIGVCEAEDSSGFDTLLCYVSL